MTHVNYLLYSIPTLISRPVLACGSEFTITEAEDVIYCLFEIMQDFKVRFSYRGYSVSFKVLILKKRPLKLGNVYCIGFESESYFCFVFLIPFLQDE